MVDIPNTDAIKAEAEKLGANPLAKSALNVVGNVAHEKVAELEKMADEKGLGGIMKTIVNLAEDNVKIDIDGDGNIGK